MEAATVDDFSTLISEAASRVETARAKVNLALHVVGRREDGMHLLDSLVVFADEADTVEASGLESGAIDLNVTGEFAIDLDDVGDNANLAWCAAGAVLDACGGVPPTGVLLELTKRLPIAAGLGGGSADAAATLRLLNRFWRLGLDPPALSRIGLDLGADVPVCLASRPSHVRGVGESVTPVPGIPALPLLLVNPGVPLRTKDIFEGLEQRENPPLPPLPSRFGSVMELVFWLRKTRNDLYEPARISDRKIESAVKRVSNDPDCLLARMSGSGATCFGIFMSLAAAQRAADRIQTSRPDWWITVTETGGS